MGEVKMRDQQENASETVTDSWRFPEGTARKPLRYPCDECFGKVPLDYCVPCRAEFDKRHQKERDRESARRRELRAQRKAAQWARCASCGAKFNGKRTDAKFCSEACRQKNYRAVVANAAKRDDGEARARDVPELAK